MISHDDIRVVNSVIKHNDTIVHELSNDIHRANLLVQNLNPIGSRHMPLVPVGLRTIGPYDQQPHPGY